MARQSSEYLEVESDTDDEENESKCSGPCRICCCICGCICPLLVVCLLWLALRIWTAECAVESFNVDSVLPGTTGTPFEYGSADNMLLDPALDLDLGGVWWMAGNPLSDEQLVSFAGSRGVAPYPTSVFAPFLSQRHWTWSDTFIGRAIVFYYSMTESSDIKSEFQFTNSSYANIVPVADVFEGIFGFKKINQEEWDRVDTYVLRRVINPNGTAGAFWEPFINWYKKEKGDRVVVYSSDNDCTRRCQYFLACFMCAWIC